MLTNVNKNEQMLKIVNIIIYYNNPKRCCCLSAALNMLAFLENSAVATELEKVSFPSNLKEG